MLTAVLVVALLLHIMSVARQVLVWMLIAVFLSMAINPAVDGLQRRWIKSRTLAVILAMLGVLLAIVAIGALFIPTLIDQVNNFANALPVAVKVGGDNWHGFSNAQSGSDSSRW